MGLVLDLKWLLSLFVNLQEWFLEVVIGLGRNIVVLQVLLSMEGDGLCLNLTLFHIDLVAAEHDGNILANANEITYDVMSNCRTRGQCKMEYLRCQFGTFL